MDIIKTIKKYYGLLFLFFIIFMIFHFNFSVKEKFTPKIRETYRPYLRKSRLLYENLYGLGTEKLNRIFRKIGLT